MPTTLPGFADPVHDAQHSFRQILGALARPGLVQAVVAEVPTPLGLTMATAAACLTLLDLEVIVWLPPGLDPSVRQWLVFHTGCRFTDQPGEADFAIVTAPTQGLDLAAFNPGTSEYPEASTTVLLQVPDLTNGEPVQLQGPGIRGQIEIAPQVLPSFWPQWQRNTAGYPLGVDVILTGDRALMGLPRTARACSIGSDVSEA